MLRKSLKFNYAKFEYFTLKINSKTEMTEIVDKLHNFKKLEQLNSVIVLGVDDKIELDQLAKIVSQVGDVADKLGIWLHSILRSDYIHVDHILGVQVIDLPEDQAKSAHIFNKSVIYEEPVRSGMKLENDGDIVVTSFVSDNAELVASGNIHVYGEARGRLIAGSSGDKSARIFVGKFNAELIAIGGLYRVIENQPPENILMNPVMISLDEKNRLVITPMNNSK